MKNLPYIVLLFFSLISCEKAEIEICEDSQSLHSFSNFSIGVAINSNELQFNERYREITIKQFNSITPENIFKASYLHPNQNNFEWAEADKLVEFCEIYNKRLHGHTLIWHEQLPDWINNFEGNQSQWEQLFKNHIQTICQHFRGKVKGWDVVNEAFNEDGTLRNSIWKEKIGASYIEKAFQYAHEADPEAILFYNDFNIALNAHKRITILNFLINLKQRGIPVHGIGMQMHVSISHPENIQIANAFLDIYKYGFQIHLSEIDISINPFGKKIKPSDNLLKQQALKLASITTLFKEIPASYQYGMTFWGVSDANTWIRNHFQREDYPLLYDDNFRPKLSYCKFIDVL